MKTRFLFVIVFLFSQILFSQSRLEIKEQTEDIGGGNHNALVIKIFENSEENVLREWKIIMKDHDAKVTVKKEVFADNAKIKDISENTIDIYAKAEATADKDVIFVVGFDLGGAFLSSSQHSKEYKAAKRIILDFARDLSEKGFKERLKNEEKILLGLTKLKEFTTKENETIQNDIELYKDKILKAEEKITANNAAQLLKDQETETQKKIIEALLKKSELK